MEPAGPRAMGSPPPRAGNSSGFPARCWISSLLSCCLLFFFALPLEQLLPLWSLFTSVFPALAAAPTGNCVLSFPFCPGVRLGLCLGLFPGEVSGKPQRIFVLEGGGGCSASQMPGISPQNTAGKGTESSLRMPAWQQQWVLVWDLAPKQTQQHLGHGLSWS